MKMWDFRNGIESDVADIVFEIYWSNPFCFMLFSVLINSLLCNKAPIFHLGETNFTVNINLFLGI